MHTRRTSELGGKKKMKTQPANPMVATTRSYVFILSTGGLHRGPSRTRRVSRGGWRTPSQQGTGSCDSSRLLTVTPLSLACGSALTLAFATDGGHGALGTRLDMAAAVAAEGT